MEKFIVVANFACDGGCDPDLYSSQWLVGTFDTVDECISASLKDLCDVACDHYECVIPEEDYYDDEGEVKEEEYRKAIEDCAFAYCKGRWERTVDKILSYLAIENSTEILSNDFVDDEYTDQRQIVKYYTHKLTF
jgi:hypothetical protein